MVRRARGRGARKAGSALACAGALGLLAAGFSCLGGRAGPDLSLPRGLTEATRVRVALIREAPRRVVEVRGPYAIYASDDPHAAPQFEGEALPPTEVWAPAADALALGGVVFRPGRTRIEPKRPGTLRVDGAGYRGDLVCRARPGDPGAPASVMLVNRLGLEEYVAGVLGGEMPLSYPEPALEAQAIAARTYALYEMRVRGRGADFDVTDDTTSQVYRGLEVETEGARRVVGATCGVVLTYRGLLFPAYFHSTCGGTTVPAWFSLGGSDIPPLSGAPCGFCGDARYARWEAEVRKADLAEGLRREGIAVGSVDRVEVIEVGPAGHAAVVRVVHAGGEVRIRGPRFRHIVGPSVVRSTHFTAEDRGDRVLFFGCGYGHGSGLCQNGARGMARAGYGAAEILRRYYPGAELVRIY
jgi:stage II sporulation protein D